MMGKWEITMGIRVRDGGVLHKIKRKENKEELVTEKDLGAQGR